MIPLILAAIAAKGIETGINYIGQRKTAQLYARQGEMERDLFGKNADLADSQALDAEARGQEAELRQRYKGRLMVGAQSTAFAGQGVTLGDGTPQQVMKSDQALSESDRLTIVEGARREAWGFRQQADIYRRQGQMAFDAGQNKRRATNTASVGTLANYGGDMFTLYNMGK